MMHQERLRRVNEDIRALDDYLGRSAIRNVLEATIPGTAGESVRWMLGEPPKRWRLVHVAADGRLTILTEAAERVRIRAMRALPALLDEAGALARALIAEWDAVDRAMENRDG